MDIHARPEIVGYRSSVSGVELVSEQIDQALLFEWADARWPNTPAAGSPTVTARDNIQIFLLQAHPGGSNAPLSVAALERVALRHWTQLK